MTNTKRFIKIETDLWQRFKSKCALNKTTMTDAVKDMIHDYVYKEVKTNEKRETIQ